MEEVILDAIIENDRANTTKERRIEKIELNPEFVNCGTEDVIEPELMDTDVLSTPEEASRDVQWLKEVVSTTELLDTDVSSISKIQSQDAVLQDVFIVEDQKNNKTGPAETSICEENPKKESLLNMVKEESTEIKPFPKMEDIKIPSEYTESRVLSVLLRRVQVTPQQTTIKVGTNLSDDSLEEETANSSPKPKEEVMRKCSAKKPSCNTYNKDNTHTDKRLFKCNQCDYRSNIKRILNRHIKCHGIIPCKECPHCPYRTLSKKSLNKHLTIHRSRDSMLACSQCTYKAKNSYLLARHKKTHTMDKAYKCKKCSYSSTRSDCITQHMITHTKTKSYICSLCTYKGSSRSLLVSHMKRHSKENRLCCSQCAYTTKQQRAFDTHIETHKSGNIFSCSQCPYIAVKRVLLVSHMLNHTGERSYACDQCPYTAKTSSHLNMHKKTHKRERPFKCAKCSYKSQTKFHLIRHLKIHSKPHTKPYKCDKCPYRAPLSSHLTRHIMSVHNEINT